jgi:hypothetical protein
MGTAHTFSMRKKLGFKGLLLVSLLTALTACSFDGGGGLCSATSNAALAPTCSPVEPPSVSAAGSWQGTLTIMKFPSPAYPFTAEITATDGSETEYEGVFTIDGISDDVTGYFAGREQEGDRFVFKVSDPSSDFTWSGVMTESTYEGSQFPDGEDDIRYSNATFTLERAR